MRRSLSQVFKVVSLRRMRVFTRFLSVVLVENSQNASSRTQNDKIPIKKESIRTLKFTSRLPCHIISNDIDRVVMLGPVSVISGLYYSRKLRN